MLLRVKQKIKNRLEDILNEILRLNNKEFKELINTIDNDYIDVKDNGLQIEYIDEQGNNIDVPLCLVLEFIEEYIQELEEKTKEYKRLKSFLDSRSIINFFRAVKTKEGKEFLESDAMRIITILSSNEETKKYLEMPADSVEKAYLQKLMQLLFYTKGNDNQALIKNFNIKNIKGILKNLKLVEEQIKKGKGSYRFAVIKDNLLEVNIEQLLTSEYIGAHEIIRKENEMQWDINEELERDIIGDMPEDLSPEEKAMYIYAKMCLLFSYDEGFQYKKRIKLINKRDKVNYTGEFSAEYLHSITRKTKITCLDIARTYVKVVNDNVDGLEAVMLSQFGRHYCIGISSTRCSAKLEPINSFQGEGEEYKTNDLERAKSGVPLQGVFPIEDSNNIISKALKKVYPMIVNTKKRNFKKLIYTFTHSQEGTKNMGFKQALMMITESLHALGLTGNEFTLRFNAIYYNSWLKDEATKRFIGRPIVLDNGEVVYRRIIWIRENSNMIDNQRRDGIIEKNPMYIIDTEKMELIEVTDEEMIKKLQAEEYVYENEKKQMPGFER